MKKYYKFILAAILFLIIGISVYIQLSTDKINTDGTTSVSWINKQKIIPFAKQEILNNIKTPSTAKFPNNKEILVMVSKDTKNLYVVSMWVDAENSYGAMLRQKVLLQIILKPDKSYEIKNIMFL